MYVVAGMYELYEQLLPTKLYQLKKIKTSQSSNVSCRMCNKAPESLAHVLLGRSALAQNKYLARHNNTLKVLYFELLRELQLVESPPAWYSPIKPKPEYVSEDVQALWDVPTYGENQELQANRIDAKTVNHKSKEVVVLEMSCPWIENRGKKDEEKSVWFTTMGVTRTVPWIYIPAAQYYHGRAWVNDYGRGITEVVGKKDKRCTTKHAEVRSVEYVEHCEDF